MPIGDAFSVIDKAAANIPSSPEAAFGSFMNAPWWPQVWFFVKTGVSIIAFVGVIMIVWKFWLQYKVRVSVKIKSGGNVIDVKDDMAKIVRDKQGKNKLQLFKLRRGTIPYTCPIPSSKYKFKKGKLDYYELTLDDNHQLHPIEITIRDRIKGMYNKRTKERIRGIDEENEKIMEGSLNPTEWEDADNKEEVLFMKPRPETRDAWARFEDKQLEEKFKKQSWITEHLPFLVITTLCVTVILTFFFLFQNIGTGLASLAASFRSIAQNCVGI